jgi:signal transduction histidine kinase
VKGLRVGALRALPVGLAVFGVFCATVTVPVFLLGSSIASVAVLLPFVAVAICAAGVRAFLGPVDRIIEQVTRLRATSPYSVLAEAAARIRTGKLDTALPGLAKVLVDGTAAHQAGIWVVTSDKLVAAAVSPVPAEAVPEFADLALLLDHPDVDYVVPVVEGGVLHAALTIGKPGASITAADKQLMRDVASGARLLLRGVALTAELRERVRKAAELSAELSRSRRRLARARVLERHRLAGEVEHVTGGRLVEVRTTLADVRNDLLAQRPDAAVAGLVRSRASLDEVLERFRSIARGVYPAILRDQGLSAALEELIVDLPRRVDLVGSPGRRLPWEVESGIYYLAVSAMHRLAEGPGLPVQVTLRHVDGRLCVEIIDPEPAVSVAELRAALANDLERLAALGGAVDLGMDGPSIVLGASLPERLEPLVDVPS